MQVLNRFPADLISLWFQKCLTTFTRYELVDLLSGPHASSRSGQVSFSMLQLALGSSRASTQCSLSLSDLESNLLTRVLPDIQTFLCLGELSMDSVPLTGDVQSWMSDMLESLSHLHTLSLRSTRLEHSAEAFAGALGSARSLRILDISDNNLDKAMRLIAQGLRLVAASLTQLRMLRAVSVGPCIRWLVPILDCFSRLEAISVGPPVPRPDTLQRGHPGPELLILGKRTSQSVAEAAADDLKNSLDRMRLGLAMTQRLPHVARIDIPHFALDSDKPLRISDIGGTLMSHFPTHAHTLDPAAAAAPNIVPNLDPPRQPPSIFHFLPHLTSLAFAPVDPPADCTAHVEDMMNAVAHATGLANIELPQLMLTETQCESIARALINLPHLERAVVRIRGAANPPHTPLRPPCSYEKVADLARALVEAPRIREVHTPLLLDSAEFARSRPAADAFERAAHAVSCAQEAKNVHLDMYVFDVRASKRHASPPQAAPAVHGCYSEALLNVMPACASLTVDVRDIDLAQAVEAAASTASSTKMTAMTVFLACAPCDATAHLYKAALTAPGVWAELRWLRLVLGAGRMTDVSAAWVSGWLPHLLEALPMMSMLEGLEVRLDGPSNVVVPMLVVQCRTLPHLKHLCMFVRPRCPWVPQDMPDVDFHAIQATTDTHRRGQLSSGAWDMSHLTRLESLQILTTQPDYIDQGFWVQLLRLRRLKELFLGFHFHCEVLWEVLRAFICEGRQTLDVVRIGNAGQFQRVMRQPQASFLSQHAGVVLGARIEFVDMWSHALAPDLSHLPTKKKSGG